MLVRIYDGQGIEAAKRIKHLKLTDLQPTMEEFPCLRHVKGAKVRAFAPVCEELCTMYASSRSEKHRLSMVQSLGKLYALMGRSWKEWGQKEGEQFLKETSAMLSHYSFLAAEAVKKGELLWSITQKHHKMIHLGEQVRHLHPSRFWCYGSESFMAVAKAIGASCTKGTPAHRVSHKILGKFRLVFHLLLGGIYDLEEESDEEGE